MKNIDELKAIRPPKFVQELYKKGKGKGGKDWVKYFADLPEAYDQAGGADKGKGAGKGAGGKSNTSSHKKREADAAKQLYQKGGKGKGTDKKDKAPYKPPTQARITESAMFAATARPECMKKNCKDQKCWDWKNHSGFPPLSKLKPSAANAATHEGVPQNYGDTIPEPAIDLPQYQQTELARTGRHYYYGTLMPAGWTPENPNPCDADTSASDEQEGFTKVAGKFIATAAVTVAKTEVSNRFVPPSTFAEELSDDDV